MNKQSNSDNNSVGNFLFQTYARELSAASSDGHSTANANDFALTKPPRIHVEPCGDPRCPRHRMTLRRQRRGCCDDSFSTLSLRARWVTIAIMAVTLLVACLVMLYLFFIEKTLMTGGEDADKKSFARLTSDDQGEESWTPKCILTKPVHHRFDCFPDDPRVNAKRCAARGCCWSKDTTTPCFYPDNYGYELTGAVQHYFDGLEVPLRRVATPTRYGDDIQFLRLQAEFQSNYRLRLKLYDAEEKRYEVPEPQINAVISEPGERVPDANIPLYSVAYNTTSWPFFVQIRRTNTDTIIFDTSVGGLTFAHQFLQLSTKLPSEYLYGLGDSDQTRFRLDLNQNKWTLFSRNYTSAMPALSAHPFYMCIEKDGKAHGVLLLNSNALEIELQRMPAITYRALGGLLDFYFLLGPTPEDVIHQYLEAIGYPFMPPYWALGLHIGITNYKYIDEIQYIYEEVQEANLPMDAIHLDTKFLMNHTMIPRKNANIKQLQQNIHANGQKLTLSFGPGIPSDQPRGKYPMYDYALHKGLCINNSWGELLEGKLWSNNLAYLDYGNDLTIHWLTELTKENHIPFQYDGVWLEMEAPLNLIDGSIKGCQMDNLNKPPYVPRTMGDVLFKNTLCMDVKQWWGESRHTHYNLHNIYGLSMARAYHKAQKALRKHRRPLTVSSSTFVGSGKYGGYLIPTDQENWEDLSRSIAVALQYSLYGIPFVGINACTLKDLDEELCLRWMQLGAFLPLFYSSSLHIIRLPSDVNDDFRGALHNLINRRYELLPYLYTLFHKAHTSGETVIRPLMHEFYHDNTTYNIDTQFLWGSALLISPVLQKQVQSYDIYLPRGVWYDYDTAKQWKSKGEWQKTQTSLFGNGTDSFSLLIRGGSIILTQEPSNNTITSRKNQMKLTVALDGKKAKGELMWDDGETLDSLTSGEYVHVAFAAENGKLTILPHQGKNTFSSYFDYVHITHVQILGLVESPQYVTINQENYLNKNQMSWDEEHKVLHLENILIPLTMKTFIKWFD